VLFVCRSTRQVQSREGKGRTRGAGKEDEDVSAAQEPALGYLHTLHPTGQGRGTKLVLR